MNAQTNAIAYAIAQESVCSQRVSYLLRRNAEVQGDPTRQRLYIF